MQKFNIEIKTGDFKTINLQMEPSHNVPDVAKRLSVAYDTTVTVEMFARYRWTFEKGKMTSDNPDLNKFYQTVDSQAAWYWSCLGNFPA